MKLKYLHIIVWVGLLFCLFSCTKFGKNITVKGRVMNPITGKGYGGVTVELTKNEITLEYYGGGKKPIKTVSTSADGSFEISAGRIGSIYLQANSENYNYKDYYLLGWKYNGKYYTSLEVDKGHTMHVNCYLVPYGKYKLKIQNVNCQGVNDTLILDRNNLTIPNYTGFHTQRFPGCINYSSSDWVKIPCGKWKFKWTVIRNNTKTYYDTLFTLNKDEKIKVNISY